MSQPLTLRTEAGDELLDLSEFEARARRGEISPQCLVRLPAVTGEDFVPACELELWKRLHEPRLGHFARTFRLARFPWMVAAIALFNFIIYAFTVADGPLDIDAMVRFGGKVRPMVTDLGESWRLLTANFLHKDALHVGMNMLVFVMVGGALENAYRALDFLLILFVSGLSSMIVSLVLSSEAVTVGASGMVYGCLGAVIVFGLKYRHVLPAVYRRVLGEAAIPVVMVCLWVGWTSVGVDNAAHTGGLLAGMGVSAFLQPRLLDAGPQTTGAIWLRFGPMVAILLVVLLGQPFLSETLPRWETVRDDAFGISVPVPEGWRRGANRLGQLAYYNGLPGLGRASFATEAMVTDGPTDVLGRARAFGDEWLRPGALGPDVFKVRARAPELTTSLGRDVAKLDAEFDEPWGTTKLRAFFVARGDLVYQLVFTYPAEFKLYERVIDQMVAGIRLEEPKELRLARARALLFPGRAWSMGRLGEALRQTGEPKPAAEALRAAVAAQPGSVPLRTQLTLALLQAGETDAGCREAAESVAHGPGVPEALEAEARCEVARGNPGEALLRIRQARQLAPGDSKLRRVEMALQSMVDAKTR